MIVPVRRGRGGLVEVVGRGVQDGRRFEHLGRVGQRRRPPDQDLPGHRAGRRVERGGAGVLHLRADRVHSGVLEPVGEPAGDHSPRIDPDPLGRIDLLPVDDEHAVGVRSQVTEALTEGRRELHVGVRVGAGRIIEGLDGEVRTVLHDVLELDVDALVVIAITVAAPASRPRDLGLDVDDLAMAEAGQGIADVPAAAQVLPFLLEALLALAAADAEMDRVDVARGGRAAVELPGGELEGGGARLVQQGARLHDESEPLCLARVGAAVAIVLLLLVLVPLVVVVEARSTTERGRAGQEERRQQDGPRFRSGCHATPPVECKFERASPEIRRGATRLRITITHFATSVYRNDRRRSDFAASSAAGRLRG